jgi:hypothetical protein
MPNHFGGDILLIFTAKKHTLYNIGPVSKKCLTYEDSIKGIKLKGIETVEVYWCWSDIPLLSLFTTSLLHRGITPPTLHPLPTKPFKDCLIAFAPNDHRVRGWLAAAQAWYFKYTVPEDEEIHCNCRSSTADRQHVEEHMILCTGPPHGNCPFGWWHYGCAELPEDMAVTAHVDWWCTLCRTDRASGGLTSPEETSALKTSKLWQ